MADFLRSAARDHAHRLAVDDGAAETSYRSLDALVDAAARILADVVPVGRRVALVMDSGASLITAIHAVPRAGGSVAPLSPRLTAYELARALHALEPAALVSDRRHADLARAALGEAGLHIPSIDSGELVARDGVSGTAEADTGGERGLRRGGPHGEWAALWTSGTGGRPRGVSLTAENLAASARASRDRLGLGAGDRWYLGLSCAHVGGLAMVVRAALLGSALVVRGAFDAVAFNELVDEGRVTHASLVPTMLQRVLDARGDRPVPRSLRCVLVGGARTPRAVVDRALDAGVPVALTYGLTEASSQVATAPPSLVCAKPETSGAPLPGVEVRVDGAGEVLVRGPTVAAAYVGTSEPITDDSGWLHTGDLGELDGDGHLRVTGRRSDRIVTGGVNVDPAEVEDILRSHPGIDDVSVVGLPDSEWGEVVAAAAVRMPGAYPDPAELETLARERLTSAKVPRRIVFVDDLPRNPNGKVDREALRAAFEP
jgi:O-succinylbenzoic acid--CoA ligase